MICDSFQRILRIAASAASKRFAAGKTLKWAEFISGHLNLIRGPHKSLLLWGAGKKKMRNLGTVQVPTEAFMAVLKLDSD